MPNGSFENYWQCPTNNGYLGVSNWYRVTNHQGSVDYFNTCATLPFFTVPSNINGNQEPYEGNAYYGGFQYNPSFGEIREYIQTELTSPLTSGQFYNVSFFVSLADMSRYGINNFGAAFTNNAITGNYFPVHLEIVPQVVSNVVISDKINWTEVSGIFQANGGERYITIGNFTSDEQNTIVDLSQSSSYAYYYFDNVSVSVQPLSNIDFYSVNRLSVYPNPFQYELKINFPDKQIRNVKIYSVDQLVKEFEHNPERLDLSDLASGLYFLIVTTEDDQIVREKIIKL